MRRVIKEPIMKDNLVLCVKMTGSVPLLQSEDILNGLKAVKAFAENRGLLPMMEDFFIKMEQRIVDVGAENLSVYLNPVRTNNGAENHFSTVYGQLFKVPPELHTLLGRLFSIFLFANYFRLKPRVAPLPTGYARTSNLGERR